MAAENDKDLTIVTFKMHAEINDEKSREAGRPIYDEKEVCEIRFPANKQTVGVFPAHEYAPGWINDPLTQQRTQVTYAQKYNPQYLAFKSGTAQVLGGTPLEELTFLTSGKRLELKALNIHTAETLAALDGAQLKQLGMLGRDLKNQAQTYLDTAHKFSDASHLSAELASRDAQMAEMRAELNALKAGKVTSVPVETESAFAGFEDEDIVNWIKDADPDAVTDGLDHAGLIALADGILAKQGKKAKKAA